MNRVTDDALEDAVIIAAKVVDRFGYACYPIFERLESEMDARQTRFQKVRARIASHTPKGRRRKRISAPGLDLT